MDSDNSPEYSGIIFYSSPGGDVKVEVVFKAETFWLTQKQMGEPFGLESHTITYHLKEIFQRGELQQESTTRKIRVVQREGNREKCPKAC